MILAIAAWLLATALLVAVAVLAQRWGLLADRGEHPVPEREHPVPEPHPYGEDRFWCRCGRPTICDDVAFAMWHVDDGSPACRV